MSDQEATFIEPNATPVSIHWAVAAVLAVLALIGGVLLGRVAFVDNDEPTPSIVRIQVLDDSLDLSGSVEFVPDFDVYVLTINTMPPPPSNRVFQVWVQTDDLVVPAGVLNPNTRTFAYAAYDGRYDSLFITVESAPFGSEQPTTDPIITADLTGLG